MNRNVLSKVLVMAMFVLLIMQSCQKDEDPIQYQQEETYSVRPDFAVLDTRPEDVKEKFKITKEQAISTPLSVLKSAGKHALVIGISDYDGTSNDLQYCDDDARDWKARLETEGYNVTVLLDQNATYTAIRSAVSDLASLSAAGNEIAFCYSGHGSQGNIISSDLYYISSQWFSTTFANATSTKMMFCFDACQIGAMKTALNANGRVIAVGSDTDLNAYDGDWYMRNGVFTYYMMRGFDRLGYIYLEPDCDYAVANMENWASGRGIEVAPSYVDSYSGDFDL